MHSIRAILLILLFLLSQKLFSQEKPVYQITKLTDVIYEISADGGGYPVKVIASVGDDGLLIVDSGEKENGTALVDALKTFGKGLPKYVINTHSHIEHLGGNVAIGKGPTYIGHENLRDRYLNGLYIFNEIPDSVLPNLTFTDSMSVFFNGEEIKLIAFPGAHDNSDIIVWFTKSKVVCTAALCNGSHFPSIDGELGDIAKYPEIVSKVISRLPEDVKIVPGHGDDCTMEEYRGFYDMLVQTSGKVRTELAKGKTLEKLQEEDILADWKSWELYVDRNAWIKYWVSAIQHPKVISGKKKIYQDIYYKIKQKGADAAVTLYHELKKSQDKYDFDERTPFRIANMLYYNGKPDDAIKFFNICIAENSDSEPAALSNFLTGNIFWDKGEKKSAKPYYEKYLKKFLKNKTVLERMKEIEKMK